MIVATPLSQDRMLVTVGVTTHVVVRVGDDWFPEGSTIRVGVLVRKAIEQALAEKPPPS
jgi:hypothetical protein